MVAEAEANAADDAAALARVAARAALEAYVYRCRSMLRDKQARDRHDHINSTEREQQQLKPAPPTLPPMHPRVQTPRSVPRAKSQHPAAPHPHSHSHIRSRVPNINYNNRCAA